MRQKGFDAYSTIDVQYYRAGSRNKKEEADKNKVDTVMLKRRVDEMLKQMQKQYDSVAALKPITEKPTISGSQVSTTSLRATNSQPTNPNALKAESLPLLKTTTKPDEKQTKSGDAEENKLKKLKINNLKFVNN